MMNHLKYLRRELNLTIRKEAEYTGMNISTLSRLENGLNNYTMDNIETLTKFYSVDTDFLITNGGHIITDKGTHLTKNEYERSRKRIDVSIKDNKVIRCMRDDNGMPPHNDILDELMTIATLLPDEDVKILLGLAQRLKKE